jgi:hypothetical protein
MMEKFGEYAKFFRQSKSRAAMKKNRAPCAHDFFFIAIIWVVTSAFRACLLLLPSAASSTGGTGNYATGR